ncbi:unnamed protein product [Durusdinium trenchii]|uniref:Peptidase C1A papain C-terminal domain-containing protein n=1 Tax=Durusdinium trenchii TaxID=1381693 RepID=A0ABP0HWD8_9DINO
MRTIWLLAAVQQLLVSSEESCAEEPSACASGFAELLAEEDDASLHLLQRRERQRAQEFRLAQAEAEKKSWPPPPFDFEDAGVRYSAFLEDHEDTPPPLTPMVLPPTSKRRKSLDLHFNAVIASCGSKLSDPARCNKAVVKSAESVFVQLHVEARMDEKVPPLSKEETSEFRDRFKELVVGDSKRVVTKKSRSEQYSGWKNLVQSGYMAMRPVVPESLAKTVNKMSSSGESTWTAAYDSSFVKVSVAKGKSKLGFEMSKEEEEEMKNHTLSMLQQDLSQFSQEELSRSAFDEEFDVRENWPECKPITSHVRYQTCNNCWSHATALITESRLCIQSRGQFNGDNAWLSQSFIAACRLDGRDYCMGGSGLLGFKTVSRWGVPTGGPDFRGNMKAGVETCYPQILPHDRGIHCPGACSPYVEYPRTLDRDLFFVQYEPRALHPVGDQVHYLVKQALMQDGPILLGMRIYQDFYAYESGIYQPTRKSWNLYMGGHAVTGMGFGPGYVLAVNSWSTSWGINGAFKVAPQAVDFGFFLPGRPLGTFAGSSYPMPLPR